MFSIRPYLKPNDPFVASESLAGIEAAYRFKHHVAGMLQPRSILEIGVRAGYSAAAFLRACPTVTYLGLDADEGRDGGEIGYSAWAEAMLRTAFPLASIHVWHRDTQRDPFPSGRFDLIHIDGDHSEAGCYADLCRAARVGHWLLVDDVHHIRFVRRAVERFLQERPELQSLFLPSYRGDCLICCLPVTSQLSQ